MGRIRRTRGALTLVFDDGYTEVADHVVPLLQKHGIRAVFAIPVETDAVARTENATVLPLHQWKNLCTRDGHELAAHGLTHRALTSVSNEELNRELRGAREATGATTLIYPGGAHDERVRSATKRYFRAARTTTWGVESLPPHNPFALRTLNATQKNFRWWKYWPREFQGLLTGGWIIETFHRVTERPTHSHDVSLHDFAWHLSWIVRLPLRIVTIRDIIDAS